jgi:MFS transporter, PPP family, 3-phenylpropionic acid transporter
MTGKSGVLLRFMTLYAALFSAFGFASPFLPAFLAERGLGSEDIGFVFGTTWALRLVCGPTGAWQIVFRPFERSLPFARS